MEYSPNGIIFKESKHLFVILPLTPPFSSTCPPPLHSSPPLASPSPRPTFPSQDACTDGPAAACSPSGSFWHGGLLGPMPLPSSPVSTGGPKVYWRPDWMPRCSQGLSQSGCWAARWLLGTTDNRESAKYHTYVTAHALQQNQTNALLLVNGVCMFGEKWSWKQMSSLCLGKKKRHMHAHLHPHSSQTQGWVTVQAFQLPTQSPVSPWAWQRLGITLEGSTRTHFPNPFYWNLPVVYEWGSRWHPGTCSTPTSSISLNVKLTENSPPSWTHPAHACSHAHSWASLNTVVCAFVCFRLYVCLQKGWASQSVSKPKWSHSFTVNTTICPVL